jgi:hypothetical protein
MEPVVLTFITSEKRVGSILRNFLRYYYTESELKNSTVTGKDCKANKASESEPLPRLEPVKFTAIMGKHHYSSEFYFALFIHKIFC